MGLTHRVCLIPAAAADSAGCCRRALENLTCVELEAAKRAEQILADSPWAHTTIAEIARMQTEFERRDGGNMGQEHGAGFDGVDQGTKKQQAAAFSRTAVTGSPNQAKPIRLQVVWERALPIRAAEQKVGLIGPPALSSDGYSIAVYGIPSSRWYIREVAVAMRIGERTARRPPTSA